MVLNCVVEISERKEVVLDTATKVYLVGQVWLREAFRPSVHSKLVLFMKWPHMMCPGAKTDWWQLTGQEGVAAKPTSSVRKNPSQRQINPHRYNSGGTWEGDRMGTLIGLTLPMKFWTMTTKNCGKPPGSRQRIQGFLYAGFFCLAGVNQHIAVLIKTMGEASGQLLSPVTQVSSSCHMCSFTTLYSGEIRLYRCRTDVLSEVTFKCRKQWFMFYQQCSKLVLLCLREYG